MIFPMKLSRFSLIILVLSVSLNIMCIILGLHILTLNIILFVIFLEMILVFVDFENQLADIFSKPLLDERFCVLRNFLGIICFN